ncbi:DNA repair protein RAD16 [Smittium mucronatum]|uniref:DNA repair protein RAD16 n=1 Tax=Smittium mucronatum TaxID=133383 RepID=A0A1R0GLJ6_9FUNG|nr:DNA repair protein RAD16 [Smittium mucronatum]
MITRSRFQKKVEGASLAPKAKSIEKRVSRVSKKKNMISNLIKNNVNKIDYPLISNVDVASNSGTDTDVMVDVLSPQVKLPTETLEIDISRRDATLIDESSGYNSVVSFEKKGNFKMDDVTVDVEIRIVPDSIDFDIGTSKLNLPTHDSDEDSDFISVSARRRSFRSNRAESNSSSIDSKAFSSKPSLLEAPKKTSTLKRKATTTTAKTKAPKIRKENPKKEKKPPKQKSTQSIKKILSSKKPLKNSESLSSSLSEPPSSGVSDDDEYNPELSRERLLITTSSSDVDDRDVSSLSSHADPISEDIIVPKKKKTTKARSSTKKPKETLPKLTIREKTVIRLEKFHPEVVGVWDALRNQELVLPSLAEHPKNMEIKMLPFQLEGLHWMRNMELSDVKGGVLADEMGMGKTIQTISLFLQTPGSKPTLVVAPTVALIQWSKEISNFAPHLSVCLYYGAARSKSSEDLYKYDVVITTYAVLESVFRKQTFGFRRSGEMVKADSLLHKIKWFRIVLDEAHNIKDRSCTTARAAFALESEYRWCLSGTPLQNRVGELYSLIKFLKCEPFSLYLCSLCDCRSTKWLFTRDSFKCIECNHTSHQHVCWWNFEILNPIQKSGANSVIGKEAFSKLRLLIDKIMLRRTKIERAADLGLPPRLVVVRKDRFSPDELDFYSSLFSDTKRTFETYASHGTVLNNYANIFELITKMRLAVNHPDLLTAKLQNNREDQLVCSICHCEPEDPIASKCKHIFCRICVIQYLETFDTKSPQCPSCFSVLTIDLTQPEIVKKFTGAIGSNINEGGDDTSISTPKTMTYRRSIVNRIDMSRWRSSTKIEALVEELQNLRRSDANIKSIVFSQYVNFLDLVQWRLNRAGFSVCRLDGRMSPIQRDAVISTFMNKPQYTVFLVSLKAGGVALNLTEASQVFICDPWWNPAVEDQAMDRIHRLGQHRPIKTTRLIVENSIEARIIEIQDRKRDLFMSTVGKDAAALSRLSKEDMEFLFTS